MNPGIRSTDTVFQFVGKNSPHSGTLVYNNDWRNFGPAIGFAYQLPWLGEGKTTIRGGYQITYQGGGRFNDLQQALNGPSGRRRADGHRSRHRPYADRELLRPALHVAVRSELRSGRHAQRKAECDGV